MIAGGDGRALAEALNDEARLRQERATRQLQDKSIASPEQLLLAIRARRPPKGVRLGEVLTESGLITAGELAEALAIQSESPRRWLGEILVEMGVLSVRLLQLALSDKLGIPYVDVRRFPADPAAVGLIGAGVAWRHLALPLLRTDELLVVAVENPLATEFSKELSFLTGLHIVPVIADPEELRQRLAREYAGLGADGPSPDAATMGQEAPLQASNLSHVPVEELTTLLLRESPPPRESLDPTVEARITDNTLVRLVNKIILEAHAQGASDIHIESNSGKGNVRIRLRKDGEMEDYLELQPAYRSALISRIKVMAGLDISEHRHAQDGKIAFARFGALPIELRVAIVPTVNNLEDAVLRLLGGMEPIALDALGVGPVELQRLRLMLARSYGLILVCGPTGSGKTTTLHSMLRSINRPDMKIWTAEDPVEITQPGLCQVQVNSRIDWTFAAAMRAFLRADPDVIMVGEMRDAETCKIGIEASLTGHLVLSTLHTNTAAESISRLLDMGMDPFNFADALIGVLSQRLARRLCPKCRRAHVASAAELSELLDEYCAGTSLDRAAVLDGWRKAYGHDGDLLLYEAPGCGSCRGGYKGRVGVYELLGCTPRVQQLIRSRGTVPQIVEAGLDGGMKLLRQDAIEKVLQGLLDRASARAVAS